VNVFRFVPGYEEHIYQPGKETLFLLLLAFLVAFALVRLYTRLARVRGWGSGSVGGVHLHHVVPGVVLVLLAGLLLASPAGTNSPFRELCAIGFGVGAALVLDEFALVFHLRDVYWSEEGRSSIDASILAALLAGLMLVTSSPWELDRDVDANSPRAIFFVTVAANLVFALVTVAKGKRVAGMVALFVPMLGWIGALRLAKPSSPWARRFYGPARLERSRSRFEYGRLGGVELRISDLIGGRPG
jgi:hypothetical protein